MKKFLVAAVVVAMLASEAVAARTVIIRRGGGFRPRTVVVNGFGGFAVHQPVRTFGVFTPQPVFINQGFIGGGFNTFAVPVSPFGFQTFQTFGGCH